MIQEKLKNSLVEARKSRDKSTALNLTVILGEFQRGLDKEVDDKTAIRIMKKLTKSAKEVNDLELIALMKEYIPEEISEDEIKKWIQDNVDFSQLKNKMQAVGQVMKNFQGKVDGAMVKGIIEGMR